MIGKSFIIICVIGLFLSMSHYASASTLAPLSKASFEPVKWHLSLAEGGFGITNQTNTTQYVQVVIERGRIGTHKIVGRQIFCQADLAPNTGHSATICELAPKETLGVDIDMTSGMDAKGTYQVAIYPGDNQST